MANQQELVSQWLPSFPYPPSQKGYWEPVTSTLNWCEEDYYATIYSAEIVNTLTNLAFLLLGLRGVINCIQQKHDPIFLVGFIGYLLTGTGSFLFHSTLKYPMQLVDELSMIYTTCLMNFASFSYRKTPTVSLGIGLFLTSLAVFITAYYHYLKDPTFHQNAYALLTAVVLFRSFFVMEVNLRPWMKNKFQSEEAAKKGPPMSEVERKRRDERDTKIVNNMWLMVAFGLSVFLGGFAIWGIDNVYCNTLRRWRRQVGLPWGILLEGHGWWHLMTGLGAYYYLVWGVWLRRCLNGEQDEFELIWPSFFSIPTCVRRERARTLANGDAKKDR